MRLSVSGVLFFLLIFLVSYNGTLLLVTPLLLLLPISLSVYRRWVDYFLALWYHLGPVGFSLHCFAIRLFLLFPHTQHPVSKALFGKSLL